MNIPLKLSFSSGIVQPTSAMFDDGGLTNMLICYSIHITLMWAKQCHLHHPPVIINK